jgi:hypothetical protein
MSASAWLLSKLTCGAGIRAADASIAAWWRHVAASSVLSRAASPTDHRRAAVRRAMECGWEAPTPAHAFFGGYQAAISAIVGDASDAAPRLRAFLVSEAGGNQPSAIATTLSDGGADGAPLLHGTKTFGTMASDADDVIVIARTSMPALLSGSDRPWLLKAVVVPTNTGGVSFIESKKTMPFLCELTVETVHLSDVRVAPSAVLP